MKKITLFTIFLFSVLSYAQVGINTNTPDSSSALDIESTTGGILIPRLTETQRDAISSPATGLMIYQTDQTTGFYFYNGIAWTRIEGVAGPQGEQGPQGIQGETGPTGATGPQGPQGIQGVAGADGTNGSDGAEGTDGSSAYEIWVSAGNTGTESDFLASLVGAQGEQGPQGLQGDTGAQGLQGPTGPQGPQGLAGADGATGPAGPQGEQGPQGPIGATGAAGTNGTNGSNGAAGKGISSTVDNGDGTFTITYTDNTTFTTSDFTGPTGATGPQGPQGTAGPGYSHYVGEFFQGGIIYHLWKDPNTETEHGIILYPFLLPDTDYGYDGVNISFSDRLNGQANLESAIAQGIESGTVFDIASNLSDWQTDQGYDDWYLPSEHEARLLIQNTFTIQKSLESLGYSLFNMDRLWTSTANSTFYGGTMDINYGNAGIYSTAASNIRYNERWRLHSFCLVRRF